MLTLSERAELLGRANELSERGMLSSIQDELLALSDEDVREEAELALLRALLHFQLKDYSSAAGWVARAEESLGGRMFERLALRIKNAKGALWTTVGQLRRACDAFEEVYQRADLLNDQRFVALSSMNIGAVALELGEWDQAVNPLQRALTAFQRLGDHYNMAGCHQNLGIAFRNLDALPESLKHFQRALGLYRSNSAEHVLEVAAVDTERAATLASIGQHGLAEAIAKKALKSVLDLQKSSGREFTRDEAEVRRVLGLIHLRMGTVGVARNDLESAAMLAERTPSKSLKAEIFGLLADLAGPEGRSGESTRLRLASDELFSEIGALARVGAEVRVTLGASYSKFETETGCT